MIRTGVVLPTFRESPDDALEAAAQAFAAGVDGVFCYDHIWPMGQPDRPALAPFPVLGALVADVPAPATPGGGPYFGTLVARVGLVPNEVLLAQFTALANLAPGRIVAALGTGDRLSEAENRAYGIPFASASERREEMVEVARALRVQGLTVWIAGGPAARTDRSARRRRGPQSVGCRSGVGGGPGPRPRGGGSHLGRPAAFVQRRTRRHRGGGGACRCHLGHLRVAGRPRCAGGRGQRRRRVRRRCGRQHG